MTADEPDRAAPSARWSLLRQPLPALYERTVLSGIPRVAGFASLRLFGLIYESFSVGAGARAWGRPLVYMEPGSVITIGSSAYIVSSKQRAGIGIYSPCKLRAMNGAHITIGDAVVLNGTSITCRGRIEIGSGTMIAANVIVMDSDFHRPWPPETRFHSPGRENDLPVSIGRNVWIGVGSTVLKGAEIGDNTIIAAGSVVTGVIPGDVVAGGVPARVIRRRAD